MSETSAISVAQVYKKYHSGDFWRPLKAQALSGVSLEVVPNEVFGLVGLNGAGKTTLIKVMVGLLRPDQGRVSIFGKDVESLEAKRLFGYLPELPYFPKYLSAWEILNYYGKLYGLQGSDLQRRVEELLELVGLAKRAKSPIREYSKGMQQRVGLAQTLLHQPKLLFLDEPMSGLDPKGMKEMRDIILDLRREGKTIFYSSHVLAEVERICDRVGIMAAGQLKLVDTVASLVAAHQSWVTLGFIHAEASAIKAMQKLRLRPSRENRIWTVHVKTTELKQVLAKIAKLKTSSPSVLSYGSPLETAFLKILEGQ